mgnify:FL=1
MVRQGGSSEEEAAAEDQGDHCGGGPQQGGQAEEEGAREAHEIDQGPSLILSDLKITITSLLSTDSRAREKMLPDLRQTRG